MMMAVCGGVAVVGQAVKSPSDKTAMIIRVFMVVTVRRFSLYHKDSSLSPLDVVVLFVGFSHPSEIYRESRCSGRAHTNTSLSGFCLVVCIPRRTVWGAIGVEREDVVLWTKDCSGVSCKILYVMLDGDDSRHPTDERGEYRWRR